MLCKGLSFNEKKKRKEKMIKIVDIVFVYRNNRQTAEEQRRFRLAD